MSARFICNNVDVYLPACLQYIWFFLLSDLCKINYWVTSSIKYSPLYCSKRNFKTKLQSLSWNLDCKKRKPRIKKTNPLSCLFRCITFFTCVKSDQNSFSAPPPRIPLSQSYAMASYTQWVRGNYEKCDIDDVTERRFCSFLYTYASIRHQKYLLSS